VPVSDKDGADPDGTLSVGDERNTDAEDRDNDGEDRRTFHRDLP
jgi:hypothetical protein